MREQRMSMMTAGEGRRDVPPSLSEANVGAGADGAMAGLMMRNSGPVPGVAMAQAKSTQATKAARRPAKMLFWQAPTLLNSPLRDRHQGSGGAASSTSRWRMGRRRPKYSADPSRRAAELEKRRASGGRQSVVGSEDKASNGMTARVHGPTTGVVTWNDAAAKESATSTIGTTTDIKVERRSDDTRSR